MARNHGRISASIWQDEDFRALTEQGQRMYLFLATQPNLTHLGVLPLTVRRWAGTAAGLDADGVVEALGQLEAARFVVVDSDTEEVLVRSLMRNDGVYRQPNVLLAAIASVPSVASRAIKDELWREVQRIDLDTIDEAKRGVITGHLRTLAEALGEPIGKGSPNPNGGPGEGFGDPPTRARAHPLPLPLPPSPSPTSSAPAEPSRAAARDEEREDVEHICRTVADHVETLTRKRPTVTAAWRTQARLLLDTDQRDLDEVLAVFDWVRRSDFWSGNVLSVPKLRQQFGQLYAKSGRGRLRDVASQPDEAYTDWGSRRAGGGAA